MCIFNRAQRPPPQSARTYTRGKFNTIPRFPLRFPPSLFSLESSQEEPELLPLVIILPRSDWLTEQGG